MEINGDGGNFSRLGKQAILGRRNSVFLRMLSFSGMLMVFKPPAHDWTKTFFFPLAVQQKKGQSGNRWYKKNGLGLENAVEASPIDPPFSSKHSG